MPVVCPSAAKIEIIAEIVASADPSELPALAGELGRGLAAVLMRSTMTVAATSRGAESEVSDRLLTVDEAAARIGMEKSWLYRHGKSLPFARKLGHRSLRFDARGLERWLRERRIA